MHCSIPRSVLFASVLAWVTAGCSGRAEHPAPVHSHSEGHVHVHHLGAAAAVTPEDLAQAAADMAQAADRFLASLSDEQRDKATYELSDDERLNWHFVPRDRNGLPLKQMNAQQRELAHALLQKGLSQPGYRKATGIVELEAVLRAIEGRDFRDPELYYFTLFGKPDPKGTWGWRFEGHHISVNWTVVDGKAVSGAPNFMGANPAKVMQGPKQGLRVLAEEEDLGRQLVKSLSEEQRKTAIISADAPDDIITGASREVDIGEPAGLAFGQMTDPQKEQLLSLIQLYAHRLREELAEDDLAEIEKAGHDRIRFAWAGALEPGQRHYYRVHGPTFLIEYDNTQNNANHIHTAWRDLKNDFGRDALREHYEKHEHDQK